nr:hypothetical protein JVH1_6799 [Rhodococcus sp. JVH1]
MSLASASAGVVDRRIVHAQDATVVQDSVNHRARAAGRRKWERHDPFLPMLEGDCAFGPPPPEGGDNL